MSDGHGESRKRDDITNPDEILLLEIAAAREQLRLLIERMQLERIEWDRRRLELQRSPRLTAEQKDKLKVRRRHDEPDA